METAVEASGNVKFSYSHKEGISTVKAGLNVLTNMNYPKEILDDAKLQ
jgi:DNA mismatch repair ATPase MutS